MLHAPADGQRGWPNDYYEHESWGANLPWGNRTLWRTWWRCILLRHVLAPSRAAAGAAVAAAAAAAVAAAVGTADELRGVRRLQLWPLSGGALLLLRGGRRSCTAACLDARLVVDEKGDELISCDTATGCSTDPDDPEMYAEWQRASYQCQLVNGLGSWNGQAGPSGTSGTGCYKDTASGALKLTYQSVPPGLGTSHADQVPFDGSPEFRRFCSCMEGPVPPGAPPPPPVPPPPSPPPSSPPPSPPPPAPPSVPPYAPGGAAVVHISSGADCAANGCTSLGSFAECGAAAVAGGFSYAGTSSSDGTPSGCFVCAGCGPPYYMWNTNMESPIPCVSVFNCVCRCVAPPPPCAAAVAATVAAAAVAAAGAGGASSVCDDSSCDIYYNDADEPVAPQHERQVFCMMDPAADPSCYLLLLINGSVVNTNERLPVPSNGPLSDRLCYYVSPPSAPPPLPPPVPPPPSPPPPPPPPPSPPPMPPLAGRYVHRPDRRPTSRSTVHITAATDLLAFVRSVETP